MCMKVCVVGVCEIPSFLCCPLEFQFTKRIFFNLQFSRKINFAVQMIRSGKIQLVCRHNSGLLSGSIKAASEALSWPPAMAFQFKRRGAVPPGQPCTHWQTLCVSVCSVVSNLCNPVDYCNPPGSSAPWDSPGKNLEWAAMSSSRVSSRRWNLLLLCLLPCRQILYCWAIRSPAKLNGRAKIYTQLWSIQTQSYICALCKPDPKQTQVTHFSLQALSLLFELLLWRNLCLEIPAYWVQSVTWLRCDLQSNTLG